jgi:hypothetical protein
MRESTAPVTVASYLDAMSAHIARGRLQSEGIPAFLHSVYHAELYWVITPALGGVQLQVPPSEAERARAVLAAMEQAARDLPEPSCPLCQSADTRERRLSWSIALLAVHAFFIPLPFSRGRRRCGECGAAWVPD